MKTDKQHCFFCGGELIFDTQYMVKDIDESYDGDEEAIDYAYHCPRCGRAYKITDPPKDEREISYRTYWAFQCKKQYKVVTIVEGVEHSLGEYPFLIMAQEAQKVFSEVYESNCWIVEL